MEMFFWMMSGGSGMGNSMPGNPLLGGGGWGNSPWRWVILCRIATRECTHPLYMDTRAFRRLMLRHSAALTATPTAACITLHTICPIRRATIMAITAPIMGAAIMPTAYLYNRHTEGLIRHRRSLCNRLSSSSHWMQRQKSRLSGKTKRRPQNSLNRHVRKLYRHQNILVMRSGRMTTR